jgi:hypothetical protein
MTFAEFQRSLTTRLPVAGLAPALAALWWAGKGQWDTAHKLVMDEEGTACAWVHAYLHRVEDDLENARYWYRRAKVPVATGPLQAEWNSIARHLIARETNR